MEKKQRNQSPCESCEEIGKRQIAAFILGTIGFLLIAGALGQAEFSEICASEFYIKTAIGLLMMFAALPLWGDFEEDKEQHYDNRK